MRHRFARTWTLATLSAALVTIAPIATAQQTPKRATAPAAAPAAATPTKAAPQQRTAQPVGDITPVLARWEEASKKIKALKVEFNRVDSSKAWGYTYYRGMALLKSPDFACLQFSKAKLDPNNRPVSNADPEGKKLYVADAVPSERIVCTGDKVLQYNYDEKVVYVYPLEKDVRQKALQEGPLPFLFNMKADAARRRYGMTLIKENEAEYLISIVPHEEIDKDSFELAFLWLRKSDYLPSKLQLRMVGEKEVQDFTFTKIEPNPSVTDNTGKDVLMLYFRETKLPDGWQRKENPKPGAVDTAAQPAMAPASAPRRPTQQPAMAPSTSRPR